MTPARGCALNVYMETKHVARTIAAEARCLEEGHHALTEGRRFRIVSDTTDLRYRVTVEASRAGVLFRCDHPIVRGFAGTCVSVMGATGCKHSALVARRLEREGVLVWTDAGWDLTDTARAAVIASMPTVADPFAGVA